MKSSNSIKMILACVALCGSQSHAMKRFISARTVSQLMVNRHFATTAIWASLKKKAKSFGTATKLADAKQVGVKVVSLDKAKKREKDQLYNDFIQKHMYGLRG